VVLPTDYTQDPTHDFGHNALDLGCRLTAGAVYKNGATPRQNSWSVGGQVTKYTSHVAFHLYQMYQAATAAKIEGDRDMIDQRHRAEIQRVSMTLIKLMEVSR